MATENQNTQSKPLTQALSDPAGYEFDFGPMAPNYIMQMGKWVLHTDDNLDRRWKSLISTALKQADDLAFHGFISRSERDKIRSRVSSKINDLVYS